MSKNKTLYVRINKSELNTALVYDSEDVIEVGDNDVLINRIYHVDTIYEYQLQPIRFIPTTAKYKGLRLTSVHSVTNLAREIISDTITIYETMIIFALDSNLKILGFYKITNLSPNRIYISIHSVSKFIADMYATGIIMIHNHPGGNLKRSTPDEELYNKVTKVAPLLDSQLLDFIVISETGYYSYKDGTMHDTTAEYVKH